MIQNLHISFQKLAFSIALYGQKIATFQNTNVFFLQFEEFARIIAQKIKQPVPIML